MISQGGTVSGGEVAWDDGNGVVGGGENALGGVAGVGTREPGALVPEADDESGSRSWEGVSTLHSGSAL